MGSLTFMNQHLNSQSLGVKQQMQQQILLQQQHPYFNTNDSNNSSNTSNEFVRSINSKTNPRAMMPLNLLSSTASSAVSSTTQGASVYQPTKISRVFDNNLKSIPLAALNSHDLSNTSSSSNSANYSAGYNVGALQYSFNGDNNKQ